MAHKRNPRAAEFMEPVAWLGRQRAMGTVVVAGQEHGRCGGTWIAEWMLLPGSFLLTFGALQRGIDLIGRLEVHADRVRSNIDLPDVLVLTGRFTLELAKRMSKFKARETLDMASTETRTFGLPLSEVLAGMPEITAVLTREEIVALSEAESYVGAAPAIVDNVLRAASQHDADR